MAIFDKLGDIARNIGDKATDTIEITKLNSKINAEKAALAEYMRKIGEYYYDKHQAGGPDDAEVSELLTAADGPSTAIAEMQAEIKRIQEEAANQAAQANEAAQTGASDGGDANATGQTEAPENVQDVAAVDTVTCPACGKANPAGAKFCFECGAKQEPPIQTSQERICPGCGAKLPPENKFCGECGHKFD